MYSYVNIMFLSVDKIMYVTDISLVTVTYMFMWLSHDKGLSKG